MAFWEDGMMSISLVYWTPPVTDENGDETWETPVEISGWYLEKVEENIRKMEGTAKQVTSESKITTAEPIVQDGYVAIGTLADFTPEELERPESLGTRANRILIRHSSPDVETGKVLYVGYLG